MTKCPYCDFASFAVGKELSSKEKQIKDYIEALLKEIDARCSTLKEKVKIETIFFGGGTPSVHSAEELNLIFDKLTKYFDFDGEAEVTLEANPGTVSRERLEAYLELGINRISFGAQTFDSDLLVKLGRGHSLDDTYRTLDDIRSLDFKSWSFDLIYGLPGQSLESWQKTVNEALSFEPPHISSYALSIEKNTPYGEIYKNSQHADLPEEDSVAKMYELAHQKFEEAGLKRYEISNWSRPTHEARHNLTYWRAEEYYAFGISAHGYLSGFRYANTRDLESYLANSQSIDKLTVSNEMVSRTESKIEEALLRLRLEEGLSLDASSENCLDYAKMDNLIREGFVIKQNDYIKLSSKGVLVSNTVISELIKD